MRYYLYLVTVTAEDESQADRVMSELAYRDDDFGFYYEVNFERSMSFPMPDTRPRHARMTVQLEACEPAMLMKEGMEAAVRVLPRGSFAPGCDMVGLSGTREQLRNFVAQHWGDDYLPLMPELR